MATENKYSSSTVKALMENRWYCFWKKDWSARIVVYWNEGVLLDSFIKDIRKLVGKESKYERCLNIGNADCYEATANGLLKIQRQNKS